jgi:hypothetical protein
MNSTSRIRGFDSINLGSRVDKLTFFLLYLVKHFHVVGVVIIHEIHNSLVLVWNQGVPKPLQSCVSLFHSPVALPPRFLQSILS